MGGLDIIPGGGTGYCPGEGNCCRGGGAKFRGCDSRGPPNC